MDTAKNLTAVIDGLRVSYPPGYRIFVGLAIKLSDSGGTIQAHDMPNLTNDPTKHKATSLADVLASVGATIED